MLYHCLCHTLSCDNGIENHYVVQCKEILNICPELSIKKLMNWSKILKICSICVLFQFIAKPTEKQNINRYEGRQVQGERIKQNN